MLSWWLACAEPDPDALLRARDLPGAARALSAREGVTIDLAHPVAEVLAVRAASDPTLTAAEVARTVQAVRRLDAVPAVGLRAVDLSFPDAQSLCGAAAALGRGRVLVVVGRSEHGGDRDPWMGGALPWTRGRLVGFATEDHARFGRVVDAEAPARLVTWVIEDETGALVVTTERKPEAWWSHSSNEPRSAARLLLAAHLYATSGAEGVRERNASGLFQRGAR